MICVKASDRGARGRVLLLIQLGPLFLPSPGRGKVEDMDSQEFCFVVMSLYQSEFEGAAMLTVNMC